MGKLGRLSVLIAVLVASGALWWRAAADETSAGDKLRILYSNRLTFTDSATPLVTVELMSGESEVRISSPDGVLVMPDGRGGSEIRSGNRWSVRVEDARPAEVQAWTVVSTLEPNAPDYPQQASQALKRWSDLGYAPHQFEVGTVFGVDGEVIDSREMLVAVAPVDAARAGEQAQRIGRKHRVETRTHQELVRRAQGTIVASGDHSVVRNPSVIWFAPARPGGTLMIDDVVAGGGGSQLHTRREQRRYAGSIYVTVGRDGKLTAVNAVPADKLLAGLVPSEMYPAAPDSALAAQSVAARTELLQKIGTRHLTDPYMLCSNQHCQVYSGAGHEHPRTTRAVKRTRGMVLLRESGGLMDTRYSASCGGHGEHNDHAWSGDAPDPSLRGRIDAPSSRKDAQKFVGGITSSNVEQFLNLPPAASYCGTTRYSKGRYRWTKRFTAAELSRHVAAHYPEVGTVRAIEPLARGVSGRIGRLRIRGDRGTAIATGDLHIRRLLGGLRSALFTVEAQGDAGAPQAFEFHGAGFGHGVGMCQLGAIGMAQYGADHTTILEHYYPGTRIKRLY